MQGPGGGGRTPSKAGRRRMAGKLGVCVERESLAALWGGQARGEVGVDLVFGGRGQAAAGGPL